MIKDMTDEALAEYITTLRQLLDVNFALRRTAGTARMLRHLDIATAVKAQRARAAR